MERHVHTMKKKALALFLCMALLSGCGGEQAAVSEAVEMPAVEAARAPEKWFISLVVGFQANRLQMEERMLREKEALQEVLTSEMILPEITLVMVGDMLMHTPVNDSGKMEDGSYNFDHLFTYTKDMISEADIAIVNQEVVLGGPELGISGYPRFNTYYEVGDALVSAGFDVVLHATNHSMDKGLAGLENCLNFWEENYPDMAVIGMYDSKEDRDEIYVYEQQGIRIAILNYTYGTNGQPLPAGMSYAINLLEKSLIAQDVARAKEAADFVILCPHWGTEYVLEETGAQRRWAEFFLECGVDLVIGTHPHVIEPVEMLTDEEGNEMLVYYSLGNYVNATSSEKNDIGIRMLGAMASVTIARNEEGEVYIKEYSAEPLVTYISDDQKTITTYPLELFTEEMAVESYTRRFDTDFSKEYCEEIWREVFGEMGLE